MAVTLHEMQLLGQFRGMRGGENFAAALAPHPPVAAAAACSPFLVLCKLVNTLALGWLVDIRAADLLAADRITVAA